MVFEGALLFGDEGAEGAGELALVEGLGAFVELVPTGAHLPAVDPPAEVAIVEFGHLRVAHSGVSVPRRSPCEPLAADAAMVWIRLPALHVLVSFCALRNCEENNC